MVSCSNNFVGYDYVFIKEMPGHFDVKIGDISYIPKDSIHTFLIRHPVKTIKSSVLIGEKAKDTFLAGMDYFTRNVSRMFHNEN